jgi:nitronate monooxygenase
MAGLLGQLGLEVPIIQAPMAGTSTPAMAAAVSNTGALGSIAVGAVDAAAARTMIAAVRARTSRPFNVNVFCHSPARADSERERDWLSFLGPQFERYGGAPPRELREIYISFVADEAMQALLLESRPGAVSCHFGLPSAHTIARMKAAGIVVLATATSLDEARQAQAAGVDAVVAQGYEAGGHRGVFDPVGHDTQLSTLALTRILVSGIALPVIAAGGIMDGAGIAAALRLGAPAVQLGTAFIACPESSADQYHRAALFGPGAAMTEMTSVISGRPARCLPNRFTALQRLAAGPVIVPDYPIAYDAGKALAAAARAAGEGGFGAHWAGQGAPLARALPAAELVRILCAEMSEAFAEG